MRPQETPQPLTPPTAVNEQDSASHRWIYLDVLRAVAILLVLGAHFPFRLPRDAFGYTFFATWKRMGWVGVDLFFVLSGFLIGGLLFSEYRKHGSIGFGRFFIRRGFKIWPPYLVFLAATCAWDVHERSGLMASRLRESASAMWPYLVHAQNYYAPLVERIGHAWSLAVEEHFYVLLPLVLIGMIWWSGRRRAVGKSAQAEHPFALIPWLCLVLMATCLGLRILAWRREPVFDEFAHHWPTHLRVDSLFVGVALAYAVHFARPWVESLRRARWIIAAFSMACFIPFTRTAYNVALTYTFGYTLLAMGSAGIVLVAWFASQTAAPAVGVSRRIVGALARVGAYSYSIYLWHMPFTVPMILRLRARVGLWESPLSHAISMAIYVGVSIGLGAVMYHLVERRALAIRERFFPSQAAPIEVAPVEEGERLFGERAVEPEGELQPAM